MNGAGGQQEGPFAALGGADAAAKTQHADARGNGAAATPAAPGAAAMDYSESDTVSLESYDEAEMLGAEPRLSASEPRLAYGEGEEEEEEEEEDEGEGERLEEGEGVKDADVELMEQYFWDKLIEFIGDLKGDDSMLMRWKIQVVKHTGGLSAGTVDVYYYAPPPKNKKYRSRVEVAIALGLLPYARTIKSMNRQQLHYMAQETREKYLLPLFLLDAQGADLPLSDALISFQEAAAELKKASRPTEEEEGETEDKDGGAANRFLCIGNTTVLNWGRIVPHPGFFTATQIFPVGFRCIRQEHDVVLDRVVDCLCEVLEKPDPAFVGEDGTSATMPWFRITVAWDIEGTPCLRVYEGTTPREVWQQILLETVGSDGAVPDRAISDASANANGAAASSNETDGAADAGEDELRHEMNETRRKYVSQMRKLTAWKHVTTRLEGIDLDALFEDTVLRLVEGMENSVDCKTYQFLDTRANVSGKKHLLKQLNASAVKMKNLERVKKKHTVERDKEEQRRKKLEEIEAKRRAKLELRQERLDRQLRDKALREKAKDVEKMVRTVRTAFEKQIPDRREQARVRLQALAQQEESKRQPSDQPTTEQSAMDVARTFPFSQQTKRCGDLPADMTARVLQVWDFLCTFGSDLNVAVVPPLRELLETLRSLGVDQTEIDVKSHRVLNTEVLHQIAMTVLRSLIHEYHKFLGLDALGMTADEIGIAVNRYTWQEVARQLLWGVASKDLGVLDQDIVFNLRSRGSLYNVDTADRRALKLIRERMIYHYSSDKYAHNAPRILGFESGLVVRIRLPSLPQSVNRRWGELVRRLERMSTSSANKIRQLIRRAIDIADDQQLKDSLSLALRDEHGRYREPAQIKRAAIEALRKHVGAAADSSSTALQLRSSQPQRKLLSVSAITQQTVERTKAVAQTALNAEALDAANRAAVSAEDDEDIFGGAADAAADEEDDEDDEEKAESTAAETGETEAKTVTSANLWETDTSHLPESHRRIVAVLNEVMTSKEAVHFLYTVDPKAHPDYYSTIRHPICFYDVRVAVVEEKYESLADIVDDCRLVFENCRCYNHEYSPLIQALDKLSFVFERLLLDWVLDVALLESKIGPTRCSGCSELGHELYRSCDRCDAAYHFECIDPPIYGNPKDWFCPNCVEERWVQDVHPCIGKQVKLPGSTEAATVSDLQIGDDTLWMWVAEADGTKRRVASFDVWQYLVEAVELPSGYTPDAYDALCLRARGYTGWGGTYMPMPPNVFPMLSGNALHRQEEDPNFQLYVDAVMALHQGFDRMTARDWIAVLSALVVRAFTAPVVLGRIAVFETQFAAAIINMERSRMLLEIDSLPPNLMNVPDVVMKESARSEADSSSDYAGGDDEEELEDEEQEEEAMDGAEDEDVAEAKDEEADEHLWDSDDAGPVVASHKRKARAVVENDEEEDDEEEWSDSDIQGRNAAPAGAASKRSRVSAASEEGNGQAASPENEITSDTVSAEADVASSAAAWAPEQEADDQQSSEVMWELRRISRRRGREDLLFSRGLLAEVLDTLDPNTLAEYESSIGKMCVPKPADNLLLDEWADALTRKAQTPIGGVELSSEATEAAPECCAFCGMPEEFLVSPFVRAQTWEEWDAHERSHARNQSLLSRINAQELWLPANPDDAMVESEACAETNRSLVSGSLVAHEFCAETMTLLRRTAMGREQHCDDPIIVDRLVGLGRARGTPIGSDSEGRLYWYFPADRQHLFVEQKAADSQGWDGPSESCWLILSERDIGLLKQYLRESVREERILLHTLWRLFPHATAQQQQQQAIEDAAVEDTTKLQTGAEAAVPVVPQPTASEGDAKQVKKEAVAVKEEEEAGEEAEEEEDEDEEYVDEDEEEEDEEEPGEEEQEQEQEEEEETGAVTTRRQKKRGRPKYIFSVGEEVFVTKGRLYWLGVVVDTRKAKARMHYKVHYDGWPVEHDEWVEAAQVLSRAKMNVDDQRKHERHYFRSKVVSVPAELRSLNAATYLNHPGRARGFAPPPNFRCCTDPLATLRHALLLVHSALPVGAVEIEDDRWNPDLELYWMRQVTGATTAHELMECQLLLEYAIKPQWLHSDCTKVFSCMPSRALALKQATLGAVALRLWMLDRGIKYDKVVIPADDEFAVKKRGRPRGSKTKRPVEAEVVTQPRTSRGRHSRYR